MALKLCAGIFCTIGYACQGSGGDVQQFRYAPGEKIDFVAGTDTPCILQRMGKGECHTPVQKKIKPEQAFRVDGMQVTDQMVMKGAGKKTTVFFLIFFFLISLNAIPPAIADFSVNQTPFSVNQTPETSAGAPDQGSGSEGSDGSLPTSLPTPLLTAVSPTVPPVESREEQSGPLHMSVPAGTPPDPMAVPIPQLVWSQSTMRWVLPPFIILIVLVAVAYYYYRRE
jgi:hypothetical protein